MLKYSCIYCVTLVVSQKFTSISNVGFFVCKNCEIYYSDAVAAIKSEDDVKHSK